MIRILNIFSVLFIMASIVGCAAIQANKTQEQEQLLSAAGFAMVPATTPAELENLNTLTPHKVLFSVKDNKPLYWLLTLLIVDVYIPVIRKPTSVTKGY